MTKSSDNADVVRGVFESVRRQDLDGLLGLYHRDVVVREPWSLPHGGVHRGLDQARTAAICRSETWGPYQENTDLSLDPEVIALNDDLVAARWCLRACDPAGEEVDVEAIDLYRVCEGKVLELETYYRDTAAMVRFLERASRAG
jgi:ketosteroid isomerase-like protein